MRWAAVVRGAALALFGFSSAVSVRSPQCGQNDDVDGTSPPHDAQFILKFP
jgi:hypothetical protein